MIPHQRKRFVYLFSLVVFLALSSLTALAFQNEPDGFRGIKWGTNISELNDMLVVESGKDTLYYTRKNDKMKIGDVDIDQISYGFYKTRFFVVLVEYRGYASFTKLKKILIDQYGKAEQPNQLMERYFWTGGTVDIYFDYNDMSKNGNVYYSFRPIQEERVRER
jgi:hypothetical protein